MRITIACKHSYEPWGPDSLKKGIGGSEQAVIHMSRQLAKLGHEVTVYNSSERKNVDERGVILSEGPSEREMKVVDRKSWHVTYLPVAHLPALTETDILIVWRTPADVLDYNHIKRKKTFLWMHDMVPEDEVIPFVYLYDRLFVLSRFHRDFYPKIKDARFYVTSNGVDQETIDAQKKVAGVRNPFKMCYTSAYDRGLVKLLESWTKVKLAIPEAELHIMYGWAVLDAMHQDEGYAWAKGYITRLFDQEGITEYGRLPQEEVTAHLLTSQILSYPCFYPETSCIAAMQAQACGAVPVVVPNGALSETVKVGLMAKDTVSFTNQLIDLLSRPEDADELRNLMTHDFSWEAVAGKWHSELLSAV